MFKLRPKCEVMLSWDFGEVLGFGGEVGSWFVFFFQKVNVNKRENL